MYSQSTAVSTLTGTTTTTGTTETTNEDDIDDEDFQAFQHHRSKSARSSKEDKETRFTASADHHHNHESSSSGNKDHGHKKGILNKLFLKFGSRKCKTPPAKVYPEYNDAPTVAQIIREMELDADKIRANRQARYEQQQIQKHVQRLREQQQEILLRQQQHQQVMHDQHLMDDKYGHYMNHEEIQQQLQVLNHHPLPHNPVMMTTRHPVIKRSLPVPTATSVQQLHQPPPLPPGRPPPPPVMQKPVMRSPPTSLVTSSGTTIIDARGVSKPMAFYHGYNNSNGNVDTLSQMNHVINPSAINSNNAIINPVNGNHPHAISTNAVYESRAALLQQSRLQQQLQMQHQSLYGSRQPSSSNASHQAIQGSVGGPYGQQGHYGVISADGRLINPSQGHSSSVLFQRQMSGQRVRPVDTVGNFVRQQSYPLPQRQQPVYQASNVYVYSNPPPQSNGIVQPQISGQSLYDTSVPSKEPMYGQYYGPIMTSSHPSVVPSVIHSNGNNGTSLPGLHQPPLMTQRQQQQMMQIHHRQQQLQQQQQSLYASVNHYQQHHSGGISGVNLVDGSSV